MTDAPTNALADRLAPQLIRGAAELETTERGIRPHRLPASVRTRDADGQLLLMESQPSGVRLAFTTTARSIELELHPTRVAYRGLARPRGAVDLVVDGGAVDSRALTAGDAMELDLATGGSTFVPGESQLERFELGEPVGGDAHVVELWLPHNEAVELVALRADAPLSPLEDAGRRWLHHGSSISQGSNAATPTDIWPVVAARAAGVDLTNLGFGGSAMVDQFVARIMRDAPVDLLSVKLGINVVNLDGMRVRTFASAVHGFLDTVRDGHPTTPIVLMSPIFCAIHEEAPGPGSFDPEALGAGQVRFRASAPAAGFDPGRLTLRVVRDVLSDVVARRADDPNLHLLHGTELYGEQDAVAHPLPDALHPDSATHHLMGERFARLAFSPGGAFAA